MERIWGSRPDGVERNGQISGRPRGCTRLSASEKSVGSRVGSGDGVVVREEGRSKWQRGEAGDEAGWERCWEGRWGGRGSRLLELLGQRCDVLHAVLMRRQVALQGPVAPQQRPHLLQRGRLIVALAQQVLLPCLRRETLLRSSSGGRGRGGRVQAELSDCGSSSSVKCG